MELLDLGIIERATIGQLIIAVLMGTLATLSLLSKKAKIACLLIILAVPAYVGAGLIKPSPPSTTQRFDSGLSFYEAERFQDAISEFEVFLNVSSADDQGRPRAHYYIASSCLKLSPPGCSEALSHMTQILPDKDGLGLKLIDECKLAGCIDCENLAPIN